MLRSVLAAGAIAGGLIAFSSMANAAVLAPTGLKSTAEQQSNIIEVRRRGGGHRGFRGRSFGGHRFHGGRSFSHRGYGRRHFSYRGHGGHRRYGRRHGGWPFVYGALPFIGYGAYSYGYGGSSCGWLWRRYQNTGSRYWYRRWEDCRY